MNVGVDQDSGSNETTSLCTTNLSSNRDLAISLLEHNQATKRRRYLIPNNEICPMGYGFKYGQKKPRILINHIDGIPEEMILNIFKFLDRPTLIKCTYVCKQWKRIACDESLWQCLNIPSRRINIRNLDCLLSRNIKVFSISHANIYPDIKYTFETSLPKLQYLDLTAVFISVENLSSLLSQCDNLVKLSLENCFINYVCCEHIGRNTKLKVLNMCSVNGLDIIGVKHILSLKNLEELNVSWARMLENDLHYLVSKMIRNIQRLNISGFLKQLSDNDLISLINRCPKLIDLDISDSLSITAKSLDFLLHNQPNLKVLSMSRCYNVRSSFLKPNILKLKIGNKTHQLQELNMFGVANEQIFNCVCKSFLNFKINKTMFSTIARPKPANNQYTIWEIPVPINC